jgi:hypothetical protein
MIAILAVLASTAHAGGGGAYVDLQAGAGWSDATGPLMRSRAGTSAVGAFWGDYNGTFKYGRYWRVGAWSRWNENDRDVLTDTTYSAGVELGRGVDLLNVGIWWLVGAGPLVSDFNVEDEPLAWGGVVRGSIGGMYTLTRWAGLTVRIEGGVQQFHNHFSMLGGFGLGLLFRNHMVRSGWEKHESNEPEPVVGFGDLGPTDEPMDPLATP